MVLKDKKVVLRDIQKGVYRATAETEWQRWAAPREYEGQTEEQRREAMARYSKKALQNITLCIFM